MEDTEIRAEVAPAEGATVANDVEPVPEPRSPRFAWLRRLFQRDDAPHESSESADDGEPTIPAGDPDPAGLVTRREVHALLVGFFEYLREYLAAEEERKQIVRAQYGEDSRALLAEVLGERAELARLRDNGRRQRSPFPSPVSRWP